MIASKLQEGKKPVELYKELLSTTDGSIASLQLTPSLRTIQGVSRTLSGTKNDIEDLIVALRMDASTLVKENSLQLAFDYFLPATINCP